MKCVCNHIWSILQLWYVCPLIYWCYCVCVCVCMCVCVRGSQTVLQYSKCGRTSVLKARILMFVLHLVRFLRKNPRALLALALMLLTCVFYLKSAEMWTPKYLWKETVSRLVLWSLYVNGIGLLVRVICWHLSGLNVICHLASQSISSARSSCSRRQPFLSITGQ